MRKNGSRRSKVKRSKAQRARRKREKLERRAREAAAPLDPGALPPLIVRTKPMSRADVEKLYPPPKKADRVAVKRAYADAMRSLLEPSALARLLAGKK